MISLVNVVLAQAWTRRRHSKRGVCGPASASASAWLTGAFNGFFIAFLRLQPIVVTLSTMFIVQGLTLLVMDKPGGFVAPDARHLLSWRRHTRLAADAAGGDRRRSALLALAEEHAVRHRDLCGRQRPGRGARRRRAGRARRRFLVYVIAGGCYGLAGVFISAQTGSGDPLVGNPLLLSMFAAVVVGGTRLGGGRGGPIGSVFGAYILMIVVNILLVLNVSAYYSTIAEGTILILAVLAGSISVQFDARASNCAVRKRSSAHGAGPAALAARSH